jgi:hypothetical protein
MSCVTGRRKLLKTETETTPGLTGASGRTEGSAKRLGQVGEQLPVPGTPYKLQSAPGHCENMKTGNPTGFTGHS